MPLALLAGAACAQSPGTGMFWINQATVSPTGIDGYNTAISFGGNLYQYGLNAANNTPVAEVLTGSTWSGLGLNVTPPEGRTIVSWRSKLWMVGQNTAGTGTSLWNSLDGATWTLQSFAIPNMGPKQFHGCAVFNDRLYVAGGVNPSGTPSNDIQMFDGTTWTVLRTNTTTSTSDLFPPAAHLGFLVHNNQLWAIVGNGGSGFNAWSSSNGTNWVQQSGTNAVAGVEFQAVSYEGNMWVFGNDLDSDNNVFFSPDGLSWTQVPSLFFLGSGYGLAAHNGQLWRVGGKEGAVQGPIKTVGGFVSLSSSVNGTGTLKASATPTFYPATPEAVFVPYTWAYLQAVAGAGAVFSNWAGGNLGGSTNPATLLMDNSKSVVAVFGVGYTLTVNIQGTGTVSKSPDQSAYASGTNVTLTATPGAGQIFQGWTDASFGDYGTVNPLTITIGGNRTLTAKFGSTQYTVNVLASTGGTVSPPGATLHDANTSMTISATASAGQVFSGWTWNDNGTLRFFSTQNPYTFQVTQNFNLIGNFQPAPNYNLIVHYQHGMVTQSVTQPSYQAGTLVTLTATADPGYTFSGWSGSLTGTTNPNSVTMNGDKDITANFPPAKYALTTTAVNGTVTRSPNASAYDYKTDVQLTAAAGPGYVFTGWTAGGDVSADQLNHSVINVTMDKVRSVVANFATANVKITITTPTNGSIGAKPGPVSGYYRRGDNVILTASPKTGYELTAWGGALTGKDLQVGLRMDADKTISATFTTLPSYTLTLTQPTGGKITSSPSGTTFLKGTKVILTAASPAGTKISGWTGGPTGSSPSVTLTMDGNKTVAASFATAPMVALTVANAAGTTTTNVVDGAATAITTTVPAEKAFWMWLPAPSSPKVSMSFTNMFSPSATVKLSGGAGKVTALFFVPAFNVFTKDEASGAADQSRSKPRVKLVSTNPASITDVMFRYYFKTECAQHPQMTWTPATNWTVSQPIDADGDQGTGNPDVGGNWYIEFRYTGTVAGKGTLESPAGVILSYPCTGCVWNRMNDYSSPGTNVYTASTLPVFNMPNNTTPIQGQAPLMEIDPPPPTPPSETFVFTVPPPKATNPPVPNLTFDQIFPGGNFAFNGSFEHGDLGWLKFGGDAGVTLSIQKHAPGDGAFDGYNFAKVTPTSANVDGIYFEIPESSPAFARLKGQTAVFSAWIRNPSGVTAANTVQLVLLNNADNGSGNTKWTLGTAWSFAYQKFTNLQPTTDGGIPKFRFAIVEGSAATNGPFDVDGVTVTLGDFFIPSQSTYKLTNAHSSVMQSRTLLPGKNFGYSTFGNQLAIMNTDYDGLGRMSKSYLPFADACVDYYCNPAFSMTDFTAQIAKANGKYVSGNPDGLPDAGGFAYSEPVYEQDQNPSVIRTGEPGKSFQKTSGHTVETFYSGVSSLDETALGSDPSQPADKSNPVYSYKYVKDQNGNGSMEWKDAFGRVVKTSARVTDGGTAKWAATQNVYDDRGNVIMSLPPLSCVDLDGSMTGIPGCVDPTTYFFDDQNRLVMESDPDAGTSKTFFDLLGRKRITQTGDQVAQRRFTVTTYDDLGRVRETGEWADDANQEMATDDAVRAKAEDLTWPDPADWHYTRRDFYYYDAMPPSLPAEFADVDQDFRLYPKELEGSFPAMAKLAAVVTIQPQVLELPKADQNHMQEISSKAYRYDAHGRVIETYTYNGLISNPAYKLQKTTTAYDAMARVIEVRNFDKASDYVPSRDNFYAYNSWGKLDEIKDKNNKSIARFDYYPADGKIKSVVLDGDDVDYITVKYAYDINGGSRQIHAERAVSGGTPIVLYEENVSYDAPTVAGAKPRFNGNISQIKYYLSQMATNEGNRQIVYGYDEINRLTSAAYDLLNLPGDAKNNQFDGSFAYDLDGRFKYQRTGSKAAATVTSGGEYAYVPGTNQVAYVNQGRGDNAARNMGGTSTSPNFKYDDAGRMIADRSKNLVVQYDINGMPEKFAWTDASKKLHTEVMRYDAGGSRIARLDFLEAGSPVENYLVDPDPNRESDYLSLNQAYDALKANLAAATSAPANITFHYVLDQDDGTLPGTMPTLFTKGNMPVNISTATVIFGSDEYWNWVSYRKPMMLTAATLYTGVGNELRQTSSSGITAPKIITNLPRGLGRYAVGSQEKQFYLNNHQGTTMVVASSVAATSSEVFDYFPYGNQVKAYTTSGDKITETYTGKELDESTNLYYYGARYYDPDLSMWISPDAARQFNSLYSLGCDPINSLDPNGNQIISMDAKNNAQLLNYINSVSHDAFYFDKSNHLQAIVGPRETKPTYYATKLMEAIASKKEIRLNIGQRVNLNGVTTDVDDPERGGGGITLNSEVPGDRSTRSSDLTISGHPYEDLLDEWEDKLNDGPEMILMHELMGHAIPWITGMISGNAVFNENLVREENGETTRPPESGHSE